MKIKLVYFSGTGNTRFISEKIKSSFVNKGINDVELFELEDVVNNTDVLDIDNSVIGIGYPVFDYMPPENIIDLVELISVTETRPGFVFGTYTTNGLDSNMHLIDILKNKNIITIEDEYFKAPGASAFIYANSESALVKNSIVFDKNLDSMIDNFVSNIIDKFSNFDVNKEYIKVKYNRFNKFHQGFSKLTFGRIFYRNLKVTNECSGCGLCSEKCPDNNLKLVNNKLEIVKNNGCLRCLRCVQVCIKRAINFTSSKRRGDYTKETIQKCYSNSL